MENNLVAAAVNACSVAADEPLFWVPIAFGCLLLGALIGYKRRNK